MREQQQVYCHVVRVEAPEKSDMWIYGDREAAMVFVESQMGESVDWRRNGQDRYLYESGDETWSINTHEIQDALGIIVEDPVEAVR